jgi:signal transduction histidine kinase
VTWRQYLPGRRTQIVSHVLDLVIFAAIMFFTEGPTSPFFVYFVFLLICGTLRWQWRGTLWSAVAALAVVVSLAFYPTRLLQDPDFELNRFIIRIVYLAVVAFQLGYLGVYQQKLQGELSKLAAWPRSFPAGVTAMVKEILEHASGILGAPRMLLAWEEEEEPWVHLASWSGGNFQYTREPPAAFGTLAAEPLAGKSFLCSDARSPQPVVAHSSPEGPQRWQGSPVNPRLQERFAVGSVLALRLQGENLEGYLFALDKPQMNLDDLVLGEVVAAEAVTRLDYFYLLKKLREGAATEERIRLARDLHDGLLQSLTGAALQLETVQRLMESDPQTARQRLVEIQRLIVAEQQDLRSHIRELKPSLSGAPGADFNLAGRLADLAARIQRHWGVGVEMNLGRLDAQNLGNLLQEIYFIVHESLINAARHAGASVVKVDLGADKDRALITVSDNGRGFPFRGRYDYASLTKDGLGPATLKERISSLGGSLAIDSSDAGARLEITLPLEPKGG